MRPGAVAVIEKKLVPTDLTIESTHFIKLRLHNLSTCYHMHRVETPTFSFMGRTWSVRVQSRARARAAGGGSSG